MEKNEIFELYDSNEAKLKPNSKLDRYERDKQIKKYIKRETNLNLLDTINLIEDTNPFNYGYTIRTDYQRLIDDRKTLKDQDKVKKTFGALREDKSSDNKAEPMIERHIMLSDKYIDILGKPLFYEFPPNVEKDNTGEKDIDLITYDENKKIINLIELKKCSYIKEKNIGDSSNSVESFIKVALQISTYYSLFKHALENNEVKKEIIRALNEVGNVNIDADNFEIRKCILAPQDLYMTDPDDEEVKELKRHYDLYTIRRSDEYDDLRQHTINSKERLFEINKDN